MRTERRRRHWDRHSKSHDVQMVFFDRWQFADSRNWVGGQAIGNVVEVAVGTGLNLGTTRRCS